MEFIYLYTDKNIDPIIVNESQLHDNLSIDNLPVLYYKTSPNGDYLKIIDHPLWNDEEYCLQVVTKYDNMLKYIKCQTTEICIKAMEQYTENFVYIINQTPELCLFAVKQAGYLLNNVIQQTFELCLEAVKNCGLALQYIRIPLLEHEQEILDLEAVKQDPESIKYVKNKTDELKILAVQNRPFALQYIKDQTEELCWIALKIKAWSYSYIKNPTKEMFLYALPTFPEKISDNPFVSQLNIDELILLSLSKYTYHITLGYISIEDLVRLKHECVQTNGLVLQYIPEEHVTLELCQDAIKQNYLAIMHIKNQNYKKQVYDIAFNIFKEKYKNIFNFIHNKYAQIQDILPQEKEILSDEFNKLHKDIIHGFNNDLDTYKELFEMYDITHYDESNRRKDYYASCVSDTSGFEFISNHRKLKDALIFAPIDYIFDFIYGDYTKLLTNKLDIFDKSYKEAIDELYYDSSVVKLSNGFKLIEYWQPEYTE